MSEQENEPKPNPPPEPPAEEQAAASTVKKGSLGVLLLILLSLTWYLMGDRYTPYTSQARVQGYVVGVAPKVAGLVTQVWVNNNQEVQADRPARFMLEKISSTTGILLPLRIRSRTRWLPDSRPNWSTRHPPRYMRSRRSGLV